MDPIVALIGIAILLGVYQIFFVKDLDKLDNKGNPLFKKEK